MTCEDGLKGMTKMKKLMNVFAVVLCAICAQAVEFDYDVNADGTITLSGVRGSVPSDLVIPSEIEGRAVTGIGAKFCEECDSLRSVKLPDSIKTVADHSFDECGKLKSVELNEGLLEIGRKAFCECPIETLELPSTLESVGEGAFTRSNIPGPLFSKSTSGLKSISIRYGDNSRFETCGGNGLYDKQEKRLILVSPYATSFRVPDGCEFIGHTALLGCGNLTSITFPESLTEIDDEAFAACVKLTTLDFSRTKLKRVSEQAFCGCIELISVSFPATLVEIGGGAFCGANKLRTVRFLGNAPYVNVDYEETSGKWGDLYIAIRDFKSSDNWVYDGYIKTVSTYVEEDATGWGEVPGVWQGRPIRYVGTSPLDKPLELLPGEVASFATELFGYTVGGLPSGLKYDKKTGRITGAAKKTTAAEGVVVTFKKSGVPDETLTVVVRAEEISIGCVGLSSGALPAGVAGAANGIALLLATETDVKSVSVSKLPAGMKYDAKKGVITGAPTKAGSYEVSVTVTSKAGNKKTEKILVSVAAMPETAVGKFNGFVTSDAGSVGTFTLTTTDAGKLTAKAITVAGTVSFSGTCWDSVEDGVYRATLTTKKGETLSLTLDSNAAWDVDQLSGAFVDASKVELGVKAQRNAFGKTWYFAADGNETEGWTFVYTKDAKAAALTVTLKADGSTSIAGSLPNGVDAKIKPVLIKVSASGYANVGGLREGAIIADFAPIVTVNKVKRALSIHANLWFDRSNDHAEGVGGADLVE